MSQLIDTNRMDLTFELQTTVGEGSDIAIAFEEAIKMHLATTDELVIDALAHLKLRGWSTVKPVLRDMWKNKQIEVGEELTGSLSRGVREGIAA